jgi:hypothetical protein
MLQVAETHFAKAATRRTSGASPAGRRPQDRPTTTSTQSALRGCARAHAAGIERVINRCGTDRSSVETVGELLDAINELLALSRTTRRSWCAFVDRIPIDASGIAPIVERLILSLLGFFVVAARKASSGSCLSPCIPEPAETAISTTRPATSAPRCSTSTTSSSKAQSGVAAARPAAADHPREAGLSAPAGGRSRRRRARRARRPPSHTMHASVRSRRAGSRLPSRAPAHAFRPTQATRNRE